MRSIRKTMNKKGGFTLIELLIVIGLLGALVGLILPNLTATREDALDLVCDYNQAGTARVLSQYASLYNALPDGMHAGLVADAAITATDVEDAAFDYETASAVLMNVPEEGTGLNILRVGTVALSANQAASLVAAGIENIAYNAGYNLVPVAADVNVPVARAGTAEWTRSGLAGGRALTFRGRSIEQAMAAGNGFGGEGIIIPLFITPTMDWETNAVLNEDSFAASANVELKVDLEGRCPVPEESFNYYIAFVKAFNDGSAARLVGTACPECGILNP